MGTDHPRYAETVRKALAYIREGQDAKLTVRDVATHVACSPAHLRRIFRTVTGQGVRPHLLAARVENAKRLLRQTALNVSEVAYAAGFDNPSNFARLFRRVAGASPTLYRRSVSGAGEQPAPPRIAPGPSEAALVFRDDFNAPLSAGAWKPTGGDWRTEDGRLRGVATGSFELALANPVPENFRLEFDVRVPVACTIHVRLQDAGGTVPYAHFEFRAPDQQDPGSLRIRHRTVLLNPRAVVEAGRWHAVRIELGDNRIAAHLDGANVFAYRDIFPSPVAERCQLVMAGFASTIEIRRLSLFDLGFLPVIPYIRQGDALFNSGLFDAAKEFYFRHLLPNLPAEEELELRFKIAMCYLRQGRFDECRNWILGFMPAAGVSFWRDECELLLLRVSSACDQTAHFERLAARAFANPRLRNGIRPILATYAYESGLAGFLPRALRALLLRARLDRNDLAMSAAAMARAANILKNSRRFAEAERLLLPLTADGIHLFVRFDACVSLSDIGLMRHRTPDARRWIAEARQIIGTRPEAAWCTAQEAACLWQERRFREAVALLLDLRTRHPQSAGWQRTAETQAAEWLCCLGETETARRVVARLEKEAAVPEEQLHSHLLLSHLGERRYGEMAAILLREARRDTRQVSLRGQAATTAGILLELAGRPKDAIRAWNETSRRFPPESCYFWGGLARALAAGKPDRLETMQLFSTVRSEMFYLAGLLYEHRKNNRRARRLFALSIREDPTLRWPALLSERRLLRSPPTGRVRRA